MIQHLIQLIILQPGVHIEYPDQIPCDPLCHQSQLCVFILGPQIPGHYHPQTLEKHLDTVYVLVLDGQVQLLIDRVEDGLELVPGELKLQGTHLVHQVTQVLNSQVELILNGLV